MPADLTFVSYSHPSDQSRRIRPRRACNACRRRKRRCNHQLSPASRNLIRAESQTFNPAKDAARADLGSGPRIEWASPEGRSESPSFQPIPAEQRQNQRPADRGEQGQPQPSPQLEDEQMQETWRRPNPRGASPDTPRFVGDLNPEARLLDKTTTPEDAHGMETGEVGIWVQPRPCSKVGLGGDECSLSAPYPSSGRGPGRPHSPVSDILSNKTVKALSDIYFAKIHPIIPLLDENEYWQSLFAGTIPTPLVHVVCLLAAKDYAAEQHLKLLQTRGALVPARDFCSQLYISLSTVLSRRTSLRKITLIRVLGLLCLHQEGGEGMEDASSSIAQAIHHAQSLALHLPQPHDHSNKLKRIFWCLWTLDRLNSATNSRPCIMSDVDIAIPELTPEESGSVAFDVWFQIAKMLNKVIRLYRPTTKDPESGWDTDFPGFEQILDEMRAWHLSSSTIATLNVFYLATAILAHRLKTITTLPSATPSRLRQQLSAIQVIRYMKDPERLKALHPFPIVVYATSLALSVSYQQLRYSRLSSDQEDAHQDFNTGCAILQELRRKWGSADAMASLAHRISTALDQLPSLDVLRVNRSDRVEGDSNAMGRQGAAADAIEGVHNPLPVDVPVADRSAEFQETQAYLETMNLFSGMDDVSWMYLDAENPVNFDSFPLMNFDGSYPSG